MHNLVEVDGELGYKVDEKFRRMTNWAPKIVSIVKMDEAIEGCIIEHPPKGTPPERRR